MTARGGHDAGVSAGSRRPLQRLLAVNGLAAAAAGVVLFAAPSAIPGLVGAETNHGNPVVERLLGAAELGTASVALLAARSSTAETLRLGALALVALHCASALAVVLAMTSAHGVAFSILAANLGVRLVMAGALMVLAPGRS